MDYDKVEAIREHWKGYDPDFSAHSEKALAVMHVRELLALIDEHKQGMEKAHEQISEEANKAHKLLAMLRLIDEQVGGMYMYIDADCYGVHLKSLPIEIRALVRGVERSLYPLPAAVEQLAEQPEAAPAIVHGVDCPKKQHHPELKYSHDSGYEGHFELLGVVYCGRCHKQITK